MKLSTTSYLLAALWSASSVLADARHHSVATPATNIQDLAPQPTAEPELVDALAPNVDLRARQAVSDPAATVAAVQAAISTAYWIESTIASTTTYVEIFYTQTFAAVPDQWTTAGAGTIGYGTLTKKKRDAEAQETVYAQPVVVQVETPVVTQYVQPVTEVMVLHTVTILANMTYNPAAGTVATNGSFYGQPIGLNLTTSYNGTNSTSSFNATYTPSNGTNSTFSYVGYNTTYLNATGLLNATNTTMSSNNSTSNLTDPTTAYNLTTLTAYNLTNSPSAYP